MDSAALIELGDRYWALGLPAAAKSVLARAVAATGDVAPVLRLTDIALAQGDAASARRYATEATKRAPGPSSRILLGRAQLAAGELAAARMSLLAAIDAPKITPWDRARAHLELARAADASGDSAGAAAQANTAFEAAVAASKDRVDLNLIEEIATLAVAHDRTADATASSDIAVASGAGGPGSHACAAMLLVARMSAGDKAVTDAAIDAAFANLGGDVSIELRRLERRARNTKTADRDALLADLEKLQEASTSDTSLTAIDRARLAFLHASLCEGERAEAAYRRGLSFQPGHTGAACKLALLMLDRGDQDGAIREIERALRIDASHGLAWRNAARMLDATSPSLGVIVGRLLDAANPGAGSAAGGVAPRLVTATAEVARHDVLAGVYAHGHRVKNLLGIIGSRTRTARKLAGDGELAERLRDLEKDVTALYEEWAQYLRSLQAPQVTVELVPLAPMLHEVVISAQARTQQVQITLEHPAGLPDVRGDRMLLREALLNIVSNAAEACATHAPVGEVSVRVRALTTGSASPLIEFVITDTGPGIPRAHLGRLFVPGFTTKETGSGVGLAIAERVVAAHHGRITVDSEEGRGTTITITLPTDKSGLASLPLWTSTEPRV